MTKLGDFWNLEEIVIRITDWGEALGRHIGEEFSVKTLDRKIDL